MGVVVAAIFVLFGFQEGAREPKQKGLRGVVRYIRAVEVGNV